jgi:dTMP kinase
LRDGFFLTLEGVEGAGKTTAREFIAGGLRENGATVLETREPGGTELGEKIRALLLDPGQNRMSALSELLLIFAARAQHLEEVITPALESGFFVICDRFTDATFAYQGSGRGLDETLIQTLADLVHPRIQPDLTVILDMSPQKGLARARRRGELDRIERERLGFFERVRAGYIARARSDPERYFVLDSDRPLDEVKTDLGRLLERLCV